ncbi:MAG TPA: methylmalonyl Co-A mutase-associated GTPase MeaB [Bacteroidales bacterium]|nr:methylmalonyl Co-A mutase-associated GTPase MeaB [Bacteroidales bacterium]
MEKDSELKSALIVHEGVSQPPSINPDILRETSARKKKKYSVEAFVDGIISGNRTILSQAITIVESSLPRHSDEAQEIIERCLPYESNSLRIGITGVPGAGKSTFIETLGLFLASEGRKLAILAIDPSSSNTSGSILGDKTRMEQLSVHPNAYIRPSPSAGTLGGVARKTRESIILCEAAGFDTILVETVGVGQSETAVHSMVDVFLLLMLAGAGDELQGMKRGIMEMADIIAITKADGPNKTVAEGARVLYENALSLFPIGPSGWKPQVLTCSAIKNSGIKELWETINYYYSFTNKSGFFEEQRKQQAVIRMHDTISEYLRNNFYNDKAIRKLNSELENKLNKGSITSYKAAKILIDKYCNGRGC